MQNAETRNVSESIQNAQLHVELGRDQPGHGEPDRGGPEGRDLEERVRRGQLVVARDLGDQGLVGRVEELLDAGVDEDRDEQQRDVDADQERDDRDDDRLAQVARDHHRASVVLVDEDAGDEADDEARHRGRHERHADEEGGLRLLVDVDAGGEVGQRGSGGRDQLGDPHEHEVALLEDRRRRDPARDRYALAHGSSLWPGASPPECCSRLPPLEQGGSVRARPGRIRARCAQVIPGDRRRLRACRARPLRAVCARGRGRRGRLPGVSPPAPVPARRDDLPPGRPG